MSLKVGDLVGYYLPPKQLVAIGLVAKIENYCLNIPEEDMWLIDDGYSKFKYTIYWNKWTDEIDSLFYGDHEKCKIQVYAEWQVHESIRKI